MTPGTDEPSEILAAEIPAPMAPRLYRVPDVAQLLAVSERYVWQLISDGELQEVKQGRNVAVRDDDLRKYIDAHTTRRQAS